MFKNSSAQFYQKKESLQKNACERYQDFLKKRKTKSDNMVTNDIKICQKMENKI